MRAAGPITAAPDPYSRSSRPLHAGDRVVCSSDEHVGLGLSEFALGGQDAHPVAEARKVRQGVRRLPLAQLAAGAVQLADQAGLIFRVREAGRLDGLLPERRYVRLALVDALGLRCR